MAAIAQYPINWSGSADAALGIGGTWDKGGQTFLTPGNAYTVESVDLPFTGVNPNFPPALTTVEIYAADENGYPTGEVLSSGTVDLTGIARASPPQTISSIDYNVTLSEYILDASTIYVIVVYPPEGDYGVFWYGTAVTGYTNGKPIHHVDGGDWGDSEAVGDCAFRLNGTVYSELGKPTNPTPANNSGPGIDFSNLTLSWQDGGGAETYDVYIGTTGNLTLVSEEQEGTSYVTDLEELETIFDASPIDQKVYWRVDANAGGDTVTGDEWNFDPRPAKPTNLSPANEATGITLDQGFTWE